MIKINFEINFKYLKSDIMLIIVQVAKIMHVVLKWLNCRKYEVLSFILIATL